MSDKEQIFKMLEGRIDTMQKVAIESIELIYNAGYIHGQNDALDYAAKLTEGKLAEEILSLKKK